MAILEIEAPTAGSTTWTIRGLVCDVMPSAGRGWEYAMAREISYDPEKRVGTEKYWGEPFRGATIRDMQELTLRLAG